MKKYIMDVHKFQEENITVLMDDDKHVRPTRQNMLAAYRKIVAESQNGDVVFCHYSGHGGKLRDDNGDEKDGYDEVSRKNWSCEAL
jgi:metacaspase-1